MKYSKPFITIEEQINRLMARGLFINDVDYARHILSTKSYYRLRAYTYPFQDNGRVGQPFVKKITLKDVIDLYKFDSKLRKQLFWALEKIEIAFRTQIVYHFAERYGSHWQMNPDIFRDTGKFAKHLEALNKEINRSSETFIKHYTEKYGDPSQPPSWMSLEVASFGLLSKIYRDLANGDKKKAVAHFFGVKKVHNLENWLHCFSLLRNICAHHSRVWNRRLTTQPHLPYNTPSPFLSKKERETIYPNKLYAVVCCMAYILQYIDLSDYSQFRKAMTKLMEDCPLGQGKEMGFPKNWQQHAVWQYDVGRKG